MYYVNNFTAATLQVGMSKVVRSSNRMSDGGGGEKEVAMDFNCSNFAIVITTNACAGLVL